MTKKNLPSNSLQIPGSVKVVFILADGRKYYLSPFLYSELSEIFRWMEKRLSEFQSDILELADETIPGTFSVLEIYSDGQKNIIRDLKGYEYALN